MAVEVEVELKERLLTMVEVLGLLKEKSEGGMAAGLVGSGIGGVWRTCWLMLQGSQVASY